MFERYTEAARRALFFARYEASRFGHRSIEVEHLVLGLIHEPQGGWVGEILLRVQVPVERIREEIEKILVDNRETLALSVEIPFSKDAKQVLQWAATEADRLRSSAIDREHVLLGILRAEHTTAASILMRLGINIGTVREQVVQLQTGRDKGGTPPQEFKVRIGSTRKREPGISGHGWPGGHDLQGFTLRGVLSKVCGVHESRIQLPAAVDESARYDVYASWPSDQRGATGDNLICFGIEHYFGVTIAPESQLLDVYVLTAPEGTSASPSRVSDVGGGSFSVTGTEYMTTSSIMEPQILGPGVILAGFSASNARIEDLCHHLEQSVNRLIVDETNLNGRFDFQLQGDATSVEELREMLRTQLRLVLTPAQREVMMLVVRAKEEPGS